MPAWGVPRWFQARKSVSWVKMTRSFFRAKSRMILSAVWSRPASCTVSTSTPRACRLRVMSISMCSSIRNLILLSTKLLLNEGGVGGAHRFDESLAVVDGLLNFVAVIEIVGQGSVNFG